MEDSKWNTWLKKIGLFIILSPLVLIVGFILFEIVGMAVNHYATRRQTKQLINVVRETVADADVKDSCQRIKPIVIWFIFVRQLLLRGI